MMFDGYLGPEVKKIMENRREFLATSLYGMVASVARPRVHVRANRALLILLTGGPSQIDTFDPKPAAPENIRGPFRTIRTQVPGIIISELFPNLASRSDRFAIVRSMHHDAPPIHEAGLQLLQTGFFQPVGSPASDLSQRLSTLNVRGALCQPSHLDRFQVDVPIARSYATKDGILTGDFEVSCRRAVQELESGARFVTIDMFPGLYDQLSWDCHADGGRLATCLNDYRQSIAPQFDAGFSKLLDDLSDRGLLDSTLIVASGEFGRTPLINSRCGRDHWAQCWSALVAGAGIVGGAILGRSDRFAGEPTDHPVSPTDLAVTILAALGADHRDLPGRSILEDLQ